MKSRDALIRLKRFDVEEKRRTVEDIEAMIADFQQMAADLDRQIAIEQERAGVTDVNHYAYPTFAKAAVERRDNLKESSRDLEEKLQAAKEQLAEAEEELARAGLLEERETGRGRDKGAKSTLSALDAHGHHRAAS
ncbi:flagellar export protein FliJ [Methyloligella sp. 2.7D]|uniref:flagellar export protein FliJ n=1 Tax=unclassified Methyloligella TaxID=2625955 RepID=UPI00157CF039|nr:flagellar export protein FliJ [Methyloligella sp. GL2]QKP76926.1 flagellar export protein FliJ [Methyloligella sp. GL2]